MRNGVDIPHTPFHFFFLRTGVDILADIHLSLFIFILFIFVLRTGVDI
jgi:hypothetical protein